MIACATAAVDALEWNGLRQGTCGCWFFFKIITFIHLSHLSHLRFVGNCHRGNTSPSGLPADGHVIYPRTIYPQRLLRERSGRPAPAELCLSAAEATARIEARPRSSSARRGRRVESGRRRFDKQRYERGSRPGRSTAAVVHARAVVHDFLAGRRSPPLRGTRGRDGSLERTPDERSAMTVHRASTASPRPSQALVQSAASARSGGRDGLPSEAAENAQGVRSERMAKRR